MSIRPRSVLAALLALCVSTAASAQPATSPYVFSERVGSEIDAAERAYFGLFPGASADASARAYAVGDSVEVVIADAEEPGMRVTMTRGRAEALGRFIETFEQAETAFYNPNWQVVSPFVRANVLVPFVDPGPGVQVVADGYIYRGTLLKVADSLVFMRPRGLYDWRTPAAFVVPVGTVEEVAFEPEGLERFAPYAPFAVAALSGVIASNLTNSGLGFNEAAATLPLVGILGYEVTRWLWPRPPSAGPIERRREALDQEAAFRERTPFDFLDTEPLAAAQPEGRVRSQKAPGLYRRWLKEYGLVSVAFLASANTEASYPEVPYTEFIGGGVGEREQTIRRGKLGVAGGYDVSLRPIPWLRFGGTWQSRADTERVQFAVISANASSSNLRGYAELILPSPAFFGYRVDLAGGIGVEENRFSVERTIGDEPIDESLGVRFRGQQTNPYWQATLEFFSSRFSSVFVRLTHRSFEYTITTDPVEVYSPGSTTDLVYMLDPIEVPFRGFSEMMWGMRLHL